MRASNPELFNRSSTASGGAVGGGEAAAASGGTVGGGEAAAASGGTVGGGEMAAVARAAEGAEAAETASPVGPPPPPQPKSCKLAGSGVNWAIYHGNVLSGNDRVVGGIFKTGFFVCRERPMRSA